MELNSMVKASLIEIDFVKRYEAISNKYNAERTPSDERLVHIDGRYIFGFHIILRGGSTEFVWVVKEGKEVKEVGEIMGLLSKLFNKDKTDTVELDLFATFLKKYPLCGKLQKPETEFLAMAAKVIPTELIEFWEQYGFGSAFTVVV